MGQLVEIRKVENGKVVQTRWVDETLIDIILGLGQPKGTYLEVVPRDITATGLPPAEIQFAKSIDEMSVDEIKQLLFKRGIKFPANTKSREKLIQYARLI